MKKLTCRACPKWDGKTKVCAVRGQVMLPNVKMCAWGYKFHKNEYSRVWMAEKYAAKKGGK